MRDRSFGRTIWNLILAVFNATLILLALCLFLALQLTHRAQEITDSFARNLVSLDPLRAEIGEMTSEVSGLRSDLRALREDSSDLTSDAAQRITARLDKLEGRLDTAAQRIDGLISSPEKLVDQAIDRAAEEIKLGIGEWRRCTPADTLSLARPEALTPPRTPAPSNPAG